MFGNTSNYSSKWSSVCPTRKELLAELEGGAWDIICISETWREHAAEDWTLESGLRFIGVGGEGKQRQDSNMEWALYYMINVPGQVWKCMVPARGSWGRPVAAIHFGSVRVRARAQHQCRQPGTPASTSTFPSWDRVLAARGEP